MNTYVIDTTLALTQYSIYSEYYTYSKYFVYPTLYPLDLQFMNLQFTTSNKYGTEFQILENYF